MKSFLTEDFLLDTDFSRQLFHEYAARQPIFDFHCHLPPQQIADDYQFKNLYDIWLKGDHYKWRAMRINGVDEKYCTGADTDDFAKFQAWAGTVPYTIGNPLYHWTHLELRRPFGIADRILSPETAQGIWDECNAKLALPDFSARGIMQQMNVKFVATTDDPIDDLHEHKAIAADPNFRVVVAPGWRPDKVINIDAPWFADYMNKLEQVSDTSISTFHDLTNALKKRLDHFESRGCRLSDHALDTVPYQEASEADVTAWFQARRHGATLTQPQVDAYRTAVLMFLASEYKRRNWVQQYHIGALRNTNSRRMSELGPDTGFDGINDTVFASALAHLLDAQDRTHQLPKTILYCLNPRDNEVLGTMIGNFQGDGIPGKIQFGSAWWFNDQKDGMERQLTQLSQLGLLSRFVGMLTDSRSFMSYTRHEYFRRIMCRMIGHWVAEGQAPADVKWLGKIVSDISFANARNFFDVDVK